VWQVAAAEIDVVKPATQHQLRAAVRHEQHGLASVVSSKALDRGDRSPLYLQPGLATRRSHVRRVGCTALPDQRKALLDLALGQALPLAVGGLPPDCVPVDAYPMLVGDDLGGPPCPLQIARVRSGQWLARQSDAQLRAALSAAGVRFWLRGGWAIDFLIGAVTRAHADVDAVAWRRHRIRVQRALTAAGYDIVRETEKQIDFRKDGVDVTFVFLTRAGGGIASPRTPSPSGPGVGTRCPSGGPSWAGSPAGS
jgi:hypothetical protein